MQGFFFLFFLSSTWFGLWGTGAILIPFFVKFVTAFIVTYKQFAITVPSWLDEYLYQFDYAMYSVGEVSMWALLLYTIMLVTALIYYVVPFYEGWLDIVQDFRKREPMI
jgi:hypothetical protein